MLNEMFSICDNDIPAGSPDELKLQVSQLCDKAVILTWSMYCPEDIRKLLGYSVYYIATKPNQNVTLYEQRDVCSDMLVVTHSCLLVRIAPTFQTISGSRQRLF